MTEKNLDEGWVSMTGMAGPHKKEWWVHMVRNLHIKERRMQRLWIFLK
jgi:hypothetical protein